MPPPPDTECAQAMALHQAGHLDQAAALYRRILRHIPDHPDSLHLLGLITAQQGDPETGIALIQRAITLAPDRAAPHNSLGQACRQSGRLQQAKHAFRTAATLRPDIAELHNNLATVLLELGEPDAAIAHYRRAVALAPSLADLWYNLANALADTAQATETETCYRHALALRPADADALGNYGRWLMTRNRWPDADAALTEAVRLAPTDATLWTNLGITRAERDAPNPEQCYLTAIKLHPALPDAHYNLGRLRFSQNRIDDAIACHHAAIDADPNFGKARLAACMSHLPIVYRNEQEVADRRHAYTKALNALAAADPQSLQAAIGTTQPFFLPYQGENDRPLQATYGQLACRALAQAAPPAALAKPPGPDQRIRLGIVSGYFHDHTVFKLFLESWLTQLDRHRFAITCFHTGATTDANTSRCAALSDRFVHNLPSQAAWQTAIRETAPHVLLYPEIGMDPLAGRLAAMRLAPVQCVAWGHPETTGMPTIDYFLSSDLMEPPDADSHYTERLIRLPHLGLYYEPDPPPPTTAPPPRPPEPIFWSGQALYKYLPRYDCLYPRIAAELGRCRFLFIAFAKSPAVTALFRERLHRAFAAAGLDADRHVTILPPMSQHHYLQSVASADVILDTPGWSGGKSTLDCLAVNPAIVTLPGRFMRARHTAAILRQINCETTIARSEDEYIALAIRLASDHGWREAVRRAVAQGKPRAFRDHLSIRALEQFLTEAVARHA